MLQRQTRWWSLVPLLWQGQQTNDIYVKQYNKLAPIWICRMRNLFCSSCWLDGCCYLPETRRRYVQVYLSKMVPIAKGEVHRTGQWIHSSSFSLSVYSSNIHKMDKGEQEKERQLATSHRWTASLLVLSGQWAALLDGWKPSNYHWNIRWLNMYRNGLSLTERLFAFELVIRWQWTVAGHLIADLPRSSVLGPSVQTTKSQHWSLRSPWLSGRPIPVGVALWLRSFSN